MKFLIDMNLSPALVPVLEQNGWTAMHWSAVGPTTATDSEIFTWALANDYVIITHDLDFGAILAATRAQSPSVIQVRTQNASPAHVAPLLLAAIRTNAAVLSAGALLAIDEVRARIRLLPLT